MKKNEKPLIRRAVQPDSSPLSPEMEIREDDLSHPAVIALLAEHLGNMYELSPPESVHALDIEKLKSPGITFWTIWADAELMGCGALKELDRISGEVKSMRTPAARRRAGAGRVMLMHIIEVARSRGYRHLFLETGSQAAFVPAQTLYRSAGFQECGPFGDYQDDPNSAFFRLAL